jgi:hypothetical protein
MQTYLDRDGARDYLREGGVRIGDNALKDHASRDSGPAYRVINGRALYLREDLDAWVAEQAARPVMKRGRRQQSDQSAA